jgi:hypothetical protein
MKEKKWAGLESGQVGDKGPFNSDVWWNPYMKMTVEDSQAGGSSVTATATANAIAISWCPLVYFLIIAFCLVSFFFFFCDFALVF